MPCDWNDATNSCILVLIVCYYYYFLSETHCIEGSRAVPSKSAIGGAMIPLDTHTRTDDTQRMTTVLSHPDIFLSGHPGNT